MALKIPTQQMNTYRAAAQQRREQKANRLALRQQRGWAVAQQASKILKEEFRAQRVVVFGSVVAAERFHQRSDVDLAVWGLAEKAYYRAVSRLLDIEASISVDLVEAELAPPALQTAIEQEGVVL